MLHEMWCNGLLEGHPEYEPTCGRPAGVRMHDGSLYVIDTYLGLFKISVETGKWNKTYELLYEMINHGGLYGSFMLSCNLFPVQLWVT